MFAYLAFKALKGRYPDALRSAYKKTRWEVDPSLGLPRLHAAKGTFDKGHGVYAATPKEAQRYADYYRGIVYLVAPLPGKRVVVGEEGWRAEGAICLGRLTKDNAPEIARLIMTAHEMGLPQVKGILRWVAQQINLDAWWHAPNREHVRRLLVAIKDAERLYIASKFCEDEGYIAAIKETLIETRDAKYLYLAGRDWPDGHFCEAIAEALVNSGHAECLYLAGKDWPDECYREAIVKALVRSGNAKYLYYAGKDWPGGRYREAIAEALVKSGDAQWLYYAGRDWSTRCYRKAIVEALLSTGDAHYLYLAGRDWPKARYRNEIWRALLATGDRRWIDEAQKNWPPNRLTHAKAQVVLR